MKKAMMLAMMLTAGSAHAILVGFWDFEGNFNDASGNGLNGAAAGTNPVLFDPSTPFASGTSIRLDGSNRVNVNHAPLLSINDDLSVVFWMNGTLAAQTTNFVKPIAKGAAPGFQLQQNNTSNQLDYRIDTATSGNPGFNQVNGDINGVFDGNWHHIGLTITSSSNEAITYLDGVLVENNTFNFNSGFANTATLVFGAQGSGGGRPFTGLLDDIALFNQVLTPDQIADIANGAQTPGTVLAPVGGVPEPSTALLMLTLLGGIGFVRRRRR